MAIDNTLHFILNKADADLPNSSVIKTDITQLDLLQSSFDPILVPSGNLKLLSEITKPGLLVKTTDGYASRTFVSPKQTIAIDNAISEGGDITLSLNPRTIVGKINVASNGVTAANPRSKINFIETDSMKVILDAGPRDSVSISFEPTFNTGLESVTFVAEPDTGSTLDLSNTSLGENITLTFAFDTQTAGGTLKPEIRAFSPLQINEEGTATEWGPPIQGLESLEVEIINDSEGVILATLSPNNPTGPEEDATLTLGFVTPTEPADGFVIAKTADGFAIEQAPVTGVASVGIDLTNDEILIVDPATPITSDGAFTIGFDNLPVDPGFSYAAALLPTGSLQTFGYEKVLSSFTMTTDVTSEDVFTFTSSTAPDPLNYTGTYTWAFNTTGASDGDVLRYDHASEKVTFSPGGGSDIGSLIFEIGPNAQNIIEITGDDQIITSGTINYNTIPPADTSFDAQTPTMFDKTDDRDTSVLTYGTLYTGPLKFIEYGKTTFTDAVADKQIYQTTGATVDDLERYIVVVTNHTIAPAEINNVNRGVLSTRIDYDPDAPQTLTIYCVTDRPPSGGVQNIFTYFIYYKLES